MKIIQKPSPHFNDRTTSIDMIVIHATATQTLDETFSYLIHSQAPHRVSAHYVIDRDGTVYQLVDESKRAWHAGISRWGDREDINTYSIGIEFQCPTQSDGTLGNFTQDQIQSGLELCHDIQKRYHILPKNVVGHSDIAPNRKQDPGILFPWEIFVREGIASNPKRR